MPNGLLVMGMRLVLIGIGGSGGTIADKLQSHRGTRRNLIEGAIAVDSTSRTKAKHHPANDSENSGTPTFDDELPADGLTTFDHIDRSVLIGEEATQARGTQSDPFLGAEIMEQDLNAIQQQLDQIETRSADAFLIVAGLGGGTGAGGAPVLAKHLSRLYKQPVYGLGILPTVDEEGERTINAARALPPFVTEVDNLLLFDNDVWDLKDTPFWEAVNNINGEITRLFSTLFWTATPKLTLGPDGELTSDSDPDARLQSVLSQASASTVGVVSEDVGGDGLVSGLLGDDPDRVPPQQLAERVMDSRPSFAARLESIQNVFVQVRAPEDYYTVREINQFYQQIADATESENIHLSYQERDAQTVSACGLFCGLHDAPRVDEIQDVAEHIGEDQLVEQIQRTILE